MLISNDNFSQLQKGIQCGNQGFEVGIKSKAFLSQIQCDCTRLLILQIGQAMSDENLRSMVMVATRDFESHQQLQAATSPWYT